MLIRITRSKVRTIDYFQLPPLRAVLGGFPRVSKKSKPCSFTVNWGAYKQICHGNDTEQFGQLIATLLGHCHGSSEYAQVCLLLVTA